MKTLSYTVRFLTPAFLGNAEQSGQWRTPPFKALLRQWWRVAVAEEMKFNVGAIREREGKLFGVAADSGDSRQSQIRIRLSQWSIGKLDNWNGLDTSRVEHPEVKNKEGRLTPVGAHLYLGYGPLVFASGGTSLKKNAAIQTGEEATLSFAFPDEHAQEIETALWLMDRYGTLGGRSRNGWGSFTLLPVDGAPRLTEPASKPIRDWRQALALDWPHALGADAHPLVWRTEAHSDWKALMKALAVIKIGLRTHFKFTSGKSAPAPEQRHWLAYPVTNHSVSTWGNNARLPNSLRFKARQDTDGKLRGVIFHVPCKPPAQFRPDTETLIKVWQQVHRDLDANQSLRRIAE